MSKKHPQAHMSSVHANSVGFHKRECG